jgi:hypothetical protein
MYNTKLTKTIKHDYFSDENIIKYPERLVIIGFIAADGCIRKQNTGQKLLIFNISIKDIDALNIINNELTNGIRNISHLKHTNSVMLTIPSDQICNDLKKYNIVERKTLTYKLPILPINVMHYFLKGYYFGDGCLDNKYDKILLIGNNLFCTELKLYLENNNIVDNVKNYKIKNNDNLIQIHFTGRNANTFSNYIFQDDKLNLLPRKIKICNNKIFNSKWTKEETQLLIDMGPTKFNEFCNITKRPIKSVKNRYSILKNNNWVVPYRGKN